MQQKIKTLFVVAAIDALAQFSSPASAFTFTPGDLVIDTVSGTVLDSASSITLQQFSLGANGTSVTAAGSLVLPQTAIGANSAISGEYGSASEGILQQSANGRFLTVIGYGVNAATFNSAAPATYGTSALGQTTSLTPANQTGTPVTTVPRVVALIGAKGSIDTTTALTGVYNQNNPRSAATVDGSSFYVSGQGAAKGDATQGVFLAQRGATTATTIDNTTDTRVASIFNTGSGNTLYVSRDFNPPNGATQNFTNVSSLTNAAGGLPTSSAGLVTTHLTPPASPFSTNGGNNGSIDLTSATANGVNNARIGSFVYLSPEQYFLRTLQPFSLPTVANQKTETSTKLRLAKGGFRNGAS